MDPNFHCIASRAEDGYPHDFDSFQPELGGRPLLYCRRCGEVRALLLPSPEAPRVTGPITFDTLQTERSA